MQPVEGYTVRNAHQGEEEMRGVGERVESDNHLLYFLPLFLFFGTSSRLVTAHLTNFESNNLLLIDIGSASCFSPAS